MDISVVFPGQGAQFIGMGKDLFDTSAAVRDLFEAASAAAEIDAAELIFNGSDDDLRQTDNTQIAVTLVNLAARQVLLERGIESDRVAGFSLGEYAALVDAGVVDVSDAFRLVIARGRIMESVSRTWDDGDRASGMAAAMGKDLDVVRDALAGAGVENAFPSPYNSSVPTVIGGTAVGLDAAAAALKAAGIRKVIPLKVSGPFHTPLMKRAREQFAEIACEIEFRDPLKPLYSNVHGQEVTSGEEARSLCLDQLTHTVMWTSEERNLVASGATHLLEVGPGSVLQGLWKAIGKSDETWPTGAIHGAGTMEEIDLVTELIESERVDR
jgi:[acyl-carrier-protein] S-malonyltransferase